MNKPRKKKQGALSISKAAYERLQAYTKTAGTSVAAVVEHVLRDLPPVR